MSGTLCITIARIHTIVSKRVDDGRDPGELRLDVLRILFMIWTHAQDISQVSLACNSSIDFGMLGKYP